MTTTQNPVEHSCCTDFSRDLNVSRRSILKTSAALGGGLAVSQMFGEAMMQATFGGTAGSNTLVVLSLRGGIDGLGVVVPHGDPGYYKARKTTAVAKDQVICADSMFGLHPKMAPLAKYWNSGELAAIQATGLPVANRSHFAAIEEVEDADPGSSVRSGWVNRLVGMGTTHKPLDAVQVGMNFPTTALVGDAPTLAAADLTKLQLNGLGSWSDQRYNSLNRAWSGATGLLATGTSQAIGLSKGAGATLAAMPAGGSYPTTWPATQFTEPLKSAARLIKADLGTDVIAIDAGSWDMHNNYGTSAWGSMQSNVDGFAQALAAFLDDLGAARQRVTVITISEFGRRVAENGNGGFDHGWGTMMLAAGAGVKGGKYYGTWPGLDTNALIEGDLKVTTDYRNVFAEIVSRRFPDRSVPTLFPGLSYNRPGFMS